MKGALERWTAYWFRETPHVDLAVLRILVVGAQLGLLLAPDARKAGFEYLAGLPAELYDPLPILHLLVAPVDWNLRPSLEMLEIVHLAAISAGFLALVGWLTRPALACLALGTLFINAHRYSYGDFHHTDAPIVIALVILAVSPAGGALSIDAIRDRMRQSAKALRFTPARRERRSSAFAGWPLQLIQWILALVYISAAISKLKNGGLEWANGYTLQYYLVQDGLRWGSDISLWLGGQHVLAVALSWVTLLVEGTFWLVLVVPLLAWIYLPAAAALHIGISVTMRAPFVHWAALYAVFIPWHRVFDGVGAWWRRRSAAPLDIYYDGRCPLCLRTVTLLDALDWGARLRFRDLESEGEALVARLPKLDLADLRAEMHLLRPDGVVHRGFFAFREIAPRIPALWPLAALTRLPGSDRIGPRVYRAVARGRARITPCEGASCVLHAS